MHVKNDTVGDKTRLLFSAEVPRATATWKESSLDAWESFGFSGDIMKKWPSYDSDFATSWELYTPKGNAA